MDAVISWRYTSRSEFDADFTHRKITLNDNPKNRELRETKGKERSRWVRVVNSYYSRSFYFKALSFIEITLKILLSSWKAGKKTLALMLLSLWGRYFFHVQPGYWVPACVSISRSVTGTITDPESHANSTLADFLTDSFNVTYAV